MNQMANGLLIDARASALFDAFYAEDIEVSSDTQEEPIRGKARVRSLIATFLVPLHVIDEAVQRILDGSITDVVYDPQSARLVEK